MEVKEIEGVRIKPGERLIIVAAKWWSMELIRRIEKMLELQGVNATIIPDGAQLFIEPTDESAS